VIASDFRGVWVVGLAVLAGTMVVACSSTGSPASTPTSVPATATSVVSQNGATQPGGQGGGGEGGAGRQGGGEGRGGGGNGGGEQGEGGGAPSAQRLAVTVTDSAIQPLTGTARGGLIEFDVTNQGQQPHQVTVTGSGANGDSGPIAPGQTARFQGNLSSGSYQLNLDPDKQPQAGPTAQFTIQ
jgi:hypothetical protein